MEVKIRTTKSVSGIRLDRLIPRLIKFLEVYPEAVVVAEDGDLVLYELTDKGGNSRYVTQVFLE